jgi:hypothetical protein
VEVLSSERGASRHITHTKLESYVTAFTEMHRLVIKESSSHLWKPSLL